MTRFVAFMLALLLAAPAAAQVGKSLGVVDANTAAEADLTKMPGMTPAIAKALVAARPFDSITALNTFLLGQKLTQEQANELYRHIFVHINLNTATVQQLESLPGVGPATAKRILEYRQKNGSFKKVEELMNIKGIGEKSFLKLKPYVTVSVEKAERPAERL